MTGHSVPSINQRKGKQMKTVLRSLGLAAFAVSLAMAPTAITLAAAKIILPGGYTGSNHPAACVTDRNGVASPETCPTGGGNQPDGRK